MKRFQVGLLVAFVLAWATPAQAQWWIRKTRPNPSQRVPELILTLKTDGDERKRLQAIEELRDYDSVAFSEIVPVLVDALHQDKKLTVRLEAVNSLARIRPIHPLAGAALDRAAQHDESWRVRWQAKTSLTKLNLVGIVSKKIDAKGNSIEPPLANGPVPPARPIAVESAPIVAPPMSSSVLPPAQTSIPRPLPKGVTPPTVVTPLPKQAPPTQGPSLFP